MRLSTNARTGAGSLCSGLRCRKVNTLSHNGGCTRHRCLSSGPSTSKESSNDLTALRPGWFFEPLSMRFIHLELIIQLLSHGCRLDKDLEGNITTAAVILIYGQVNSGWLFPMGSSLHVPCKPHGRAGSKSQFSYNLIAIFEYFSYSSRIIPGSNIIWHCLTLF